MSGAAWSEIPTPTEFPTLDDVVTHEAVLRHRSRAEHREVAREGEELYARRAAVLEEVERWLPAAWRDGLVGGLVANERERAGMSARFHRMRLHDVERQAFYDRIRSEEFEPLLEAAGLDDVRGR